MSTCDTSLQAMSSVWIQVVSSLSNELFDLKSLIQRMFGIFRDYVFLRGLPLLDIDSEGKQEMGEIKGVRRATKVPGDSCKHAVMWHAL